MKFFSGELGQNYETYTFGYTNYCLRENGDDLAKIYGQGFLPYSGSPAAKNIFYMARSARVPLQEFEFSSENRRIAKKFEAQFEIEVRPKEKFNVKNKKFINFCIEYFSKRHGEKVMPLERLMQIIQNEILTHIIEYKIDNKPIAYVFMAEEGLISHFWYSFYDLSLVHQSLGMWLMLDCAHRAKELNKKYFYIGTVYGEKALYKTAFKNLEFWSGQEWLADTKKLKILARQDSKHTLSFTDLWKEGLDLF